MHCACIHANHGPFAEVQAATERAAAPDVSATHTHFAVALPEREVGCVAYQPNRSGTWAVLTSHAIPVRLEDGAGGTLPVHLAHAVTSCADLAHAAVYSLEAGIDYTLCFEDADEVGIVLEKLSDFAARHGRDRDTDGFGSADESRTTPCALPEGWVTNVDDCDDGDPAVHPDASERCDPIDHDCDGQQTNGLEDCEIAEPRDGGVGPADGASSGGCSAAPGRSAQSEGWLSLLLMTWAWRRRRRRMGSAMWLACVAVFLPQRAYAQHVDILLATRNGRVETGAYDFGKARAELPQGAFARAFEDVGDGRATGNDPGFNAVLEPPAPWAALPPDAPVHIAPARHEPGLMVWDGQEPVRFDAAPEGVWLEVARTGLFGTLDDLRIDATGSSSEAFELAHTDSRGTLHEHLQLSVFGEEGETPAAGVYGAAVSLGAGALSPSRATYLLLHDGVPGQAAERATRCVEDYLVPDCDDGIDNDGNGATDLEDPGCTGPEDLSEQPDCNDGIDNDGDGFVDRDDPTCEPGGQGPTECATCSELALPWTCLGSLPRMEEHPGTGGDAGAAPIVDASTGLAGSSSDASVEERLRLHADLRHEQRGRHREGG